MAGSEGARPGRRVVVFARDPDPGRVKTRLIPRLGAERAAQLHLAALADLIERLARARRFDVVLYHDAPRPHAGLVALGVPLCRQAGGDLGARLGQAFAAEAAAGHRGVVVLGADAPDLPLSRLDAAFTALERAPIVVAPALDGGYVLVGAVGVPPAVLERIPWGTERVLAVTLERARQAGVRVELLEPWYDLDRPEDLEVLARQLELGWLASGADDCPRTRRFLAGLA